jgi:hypothetical protein
VRSVRMNGVIRTERTGGSLCRKARVRLAEVDMF